MGRLGVYLEFHTIIHLCIHLIHLSVQTKISRALRSSFGRRASNSQCDLTTAEAVSAIEESTKDIQLLAKAAKRYIFHIVIPWFDISDYGSVIIPPKLPLELR